MITKKARSFKHWAADGQMGTIVKVYRDWQLSGNDDALKRMWPNIKKAMAFAWTGPWDTNKDGVMEGSQHNTMDIEYFGPNPQMAGWYLAALKAASAMATYMNDAAFAAECLELFEKGSKWVDKNLFNGEYYEQIIPKENNGVAQLGKGCLVDQLVGQYLAHTAELGYVLNGDNQKKTLKSIRKYNWVSDFNNHTNTFRSFALGKEKGLIMASYPRGGLLDFPFPYYTELMTGFEYSTAVHMMYEGMRNEGLEVFKAIRERYDGEKRNPFNEGEYGHRYARAMASWAGVLAWSGFHYSAVDKTMKFGDVPGTFFWSNGYAFGTITNSIKDKKTNITIKVIEGKIELERFELKGKKPFLFTGKTVLGPGKTIRITL
jgi:non-lysosomal glucosylceramidase